MKTGALVLAALFFLSADKVEVINLQQLKNVAENKTDDTLYVVNFWATWCKPCVAEMPYFVEAAEKFGVQKVKVVFVSLNSPKELSKVNKFAADNKIQQQMLLLDAGNPNVWIDSVEKTWSGTIPATIMYRKGNKVLFHEGELGKEKLHSIIQTKIQ